MSKKFKGKLFVFSAPSGSGKTTIVRYLLGQKKLNLEFSISATSRGARPKELDGSDYYFLSVSEFKEKIKNNEFLEWEEVYSGHLYGTLKSEIERIWSQGKHVIFDVDVIGGLHIKQQFPDDTLAIFIKPPSIAELRKRLEARGSESEEKINMRIAKATTELEKAKKFDKIIENLHLEEALLEAENTITSFLNKEKLTD